MNRVNKKDSTMPRKMIMNHYEEGFNAMLEGVEGNKPESVRKPSDEERWKEFICEG